MVLLVDELGTIKGVELEKGVVYEIKYILYYRHYTVFSI